MFCAGILQLFQMFHLWTKFWGECILVSLLRTIKFMFDVSNMYCAKFRRNVLLIALSSYLGLNRTVKKVHCCIPACRWRMLQSKWWTDRRFSAIILRSEPKFFFFIKKSFNLRKHHSLQHCLRKVRSGNKLGIFRALQLSTLLSEDAGEVFGKLLVCELTPLVPPSWMFLTMGETSNGKVRSASETFFPRRFESVWDLVTRSEAAE